MSDRRKSRKSRGRSRHRSFGPRFSNLPLAALLLAALVGLPSCTPAESPLSQTPPTFQGTPPIQIASTVGMLSDLVTAIAGERGNVTTLMGPGTDPHLYKASPGDVATLRESDLILFVGHHLEGRMADAFERLGEDQLSIAVVERIPDSELLSADGSIDPHLWFDARRWGLVAAEIRDILVAFDPEGATGYRERATQLIAQLTALDAEVREQIAAIPAEKRVLITAHDAFRYFGNAYGIEVIGVQGLSTESEAAVHRINELVETIVRRKIPAVFVESTISRKNIEALVEGCRSRGHTLSIGGELYSDAMGPAGTPAGTYFGMVRHNVQVLTQALK